MERDLDDNLKPILLNNTPFVYAHLIKFERPSIMQNVSKTKPSTNKENYTYLTDASINIPFNDGSKNDAGGSNGSITYRAQKILKVGTYSETISAKATNMNLVVDSTALDASVTSTTISFSNSNTITITGEDDFLSIGIREGDRITISGASNSGNNTSVNVTGFTNNNQTIAIETLNSLFTTFTTESPGQSITIKVDSPEIQGPLFNKPSDLTASAYANRVVFIYKAFLNPDDMSIYGAPNLVFKGFINSTSLRENPERDTKVTWRLTSHWGDFNLVGGRSTNNASHRALNSNGLVEPGALMKPQYAYDLGFVHGDVALSTIAHYLTSETKNDLVGKKRGLLRRSYKLVETEVDKENEVDLKIDVQSQKIPIVYGVQFVEPMTVFADTNKVIAGGNTTVYRIDALCEGEIQGIFDIQIEEQPLICTNPSDFTDRGLGGANEAEADIVCYGTATRGHTLGGDGYQNWQKAIIDHVGMFGHEESAAYQFPGEMGQAHAEAIFAGIPQVNNEWLGSYVNMPLPGNVREQAMHFMKTPDLPSGQTGLRYSDGKGLYEKSYFIIGSPNELTLNTHTGSSYQEADGSFVKIASDENFKRQVDYWEDGDKFTYWGPNHRLLDTAYTSIACTINGEETQIPDIKYVVKGKMVECFNYDYSYEPVSFSQNNHAQFDFGDTVDIIHITTGTIYVQNAMVIDKFWHYNQHQQLVYRYRLGNNLGEPINVTPALSGATQFRMKKGNEYWAMQTYDHLDIDNQIVGAGLSVDTTAVSTSSTSVVYTVASTPSWLTTDTEIILMPKSGSDNSLVENSTFKEELIYVAQVSGTSITLKNTTNATAFRNFHKISGTEELPRLAPSRMIQLDSSASTTADAYTNKRLILRRHTPTGVMIQERVITEYPGGTGRLATVSVPWDKSYVPKVYNYRPNPFESTHDKYDIRNDLRDARCTNNPSMQLLDYLTGVYGKDIDIDEIDLPTFQLAGRTCDTQSDVTLTSTTAINVTAGDVYQVFDGAGTPNMVWQGQIKTTATSVTKITFTNCIGKINRLWDNYTSYPTGRIVEYKSGLYKTNDSGILTNPPTGMTLISSFVLDKVGSGSNITADASYGNLIEYALYDADDVKYWRYYGWESRDQRWVTRHQLNLTVDTKRSIFQNVNAFLQQFNGILSYQSGKYSLSVETQTDPISSTITNGYEQNPRYIRNEDIIGQVSVKDVGPSKSYNSLQSTIVDPALKWGDRQISFYDSTYLKQDRGVKKEGRITTSAITNYQNARISVENYLRKSRFGVSVSFTIGPKGLLLLAGDTIKLTYDRFSWSEKVFRITNLQFKEDCTVQISAHEYDDSMYTITGPTSWDMDILDNKGGLSAAINPPDNLEAQTVTNGIQLNWDNDSNLSNNSVTEIWWSATNNRAQAKLVKTTESSQEKWMYPETSDTAAQYFWCRHKRPMVGSQGISRNVSTAKYSTWEPVSATGGVSGSITAISTGSNTRSVKLESNKYVVVYDEDGDETTDFTLTASVQNMTPGANLYYGFYKNGSSTALQNNTGTNAHILNLNDSHDPAIGGTTTIQVKVREGADDAAVVASDTITLFSVQDGSDAVVAFITNQAHTVPATANGTVASFDGAGGQAKAFVGSTEVTSSCGFSIVSPTSGLSMSIGGNGAYTVSSLSAVSGTATIRISVPASLITGSNAKTFDMIYSIAKSKEGSNGLSTHLSSTDYSIVYDADGANPSFTAGAVSGKIRLSASNFGYEQPRYRFFLGTSSTPVQDWSSTAYYDYTINSTLGGFGNTKVFKLEAREGDSGSASAEDSVSIFGIQTGSKGESIREITIWKSQSFSAPWEAYSATQYMAAPTGGSYNFATSALTPPTGWTSAPGVSSKTVFNFASVGMAQGTNTSTDSSITWSTPVRQSDVGTIDIIYKRAATNPGAISDTQSGTIPSGWETDITQVPAGYTPLWFSQGSWGGTDIIVSGGFGSNHASVTTTTWGYPKQLDGQDAHIGFITNASHTVATTEGGTGYNLTNAGGTFERFKGSTDVTGSNTTYAMGTSGTAVTATQNGLTFTINQSTGVYTLSGGSWTSNEEIFTVRATYENVTITAKYTIAKSLGGAAAYDIDTDNLAVVFKASAAGAVSSYSGSGMVIKVSKKGTALTATSGTPSAGQFKVTASASGITVATPTVSGTTYTYGNASGMANNTDTAKITYTINCENIVSISRVQNFSKGTAGNNGIKSAVPDVWYTSASSSQPSTPTATSYTFATRAYSGLSSGWSTTKPTIAAASANDWWVSQVRATENSADAGISSGSNLVFATPVKRFSGMGNVIARDENDWAIDFANLNPRISIGGNVISTATTPVGVRNPNFTTGGSLPGSPSDGDVHYNTTTKRLYKYKA